MINVISLIARYPLTTLVLGIGTALTTNFATNGVTDGGVESKALPPAIIHSIEPGPTTTATTTVTSTPSELPTPTVTVTVVTTPTVTLLPTPNFSPTPSPTPTVTRTPRNMGNGIKGECFAIKDHDIYIKVPCPKEQ